MPDNQPSEAVRDLVEALKHLLTASISCANPKTDADMEDVITAENHAYAAIFAVTGAAEWHPAQQITGSSLMLTCNKIDALRAELAACQADNRRLEISIAEAAAEIWCAGPVAHRIRVLKGHHNAQIERLLDRVADSERYIPEGALLDYERKHGKI